MKDCAPLFKMFSTLQNFTICFAVLLIWIIPESGFSQSPSTDKKETIKSSPPTANRLQWINSQQKGIHEIHFVGGYSFHSTQGFWGKIPDAELRVWGMRYNRKLLYFDNDHIIEYVGELNFAVHYNLKDTPFRYGTGSISGFGATPIGFQVNFHKQNLVQPFFKSSAGFMYLNERFPNEQGTQFNFTLELGGGLEFVVAQNFSFTVGYKYHHMSNGQFGTINPGVDSNVFYTGITIF